MCSARHWLRPASGSPRHRTLPLTGAGAGAGAGAGGGSRGGSGSRRRGRRRVRGQREPVEEEVAVAAGRVVVVLERDGDAVRPGRDRDGLAVVGPPGRGDREGADDGAVGAHLGVRRAAALGAAGADGDRGAVTRGRDRLGGAAVGPVVQGLATARGGVADQLGPEGAVDRVDDAVFHALGLVGLGGAERRVGGKRGEGKTGGGGKASGHATRKRVRTSLRHSSRQPGCLRETPGFASPPRDGFALVEKNCSASERADQRVSGPVAGLCSLTLLTVVGG
jgi:hypothetical protein